MKLDEDDELDDEEGDVVAVTVEVGPLGFVLMADEAIILLVFCVLDDDGVSPRLAL